VVKVTPAHDFNDYAVGQRHGLPMIIVILTLECGRPGSTNTPLPARYRGLDRFEARKQHRRRSRSPGPARATKPHKLMVPRGDRTNAVIEPMLTDQWFVAMSKPGPKARCPGKSIARSRWRSSPTVRSASCPRTGRQHLQPLAQQHPGLVHLAPALVGPPDSGLVQGRADGAPPRRRRIRRPAAEEAARAGRGGRLDRVPLVRDEDVLDTWFSSALVPFSTLVDPE
jgi:valyl-tRNA synthetase